MHPRFAFVVTELVCVSRDSVTHLYREIESNLQVLSSKRRDIYFNFIPRFSLLVSSYYIIARPSSRLIISFYSAACICINNDRVINLLCVCVCVWLSVYVRISSLGSNDNRKWDTRVSRTVAMGCVASRTIVFHRNKELHNLK